MTNTRFNPYVQEEPHKADELLAQIQQQYDRTKAATLALVDLMESNLLLLARHHVESRYKVEELLEKIRLDFRAVDAEYSARGYGGWRSALKSVDRARKEHFDRESKVRAQAAKAAREAAIHQENGEYFRIKETEVVGPDGLVSVKKSRIPMTYDQVLAFQSKASIL